MTMIAYEAHQILAMVNDRIQYHTHNRDYWWRQCERKTAMQRAKGETPIGSDHYEHARMYEHVHALHELIVIQDRIKREIESAELRAKFEARGREDGDSTSGWVIDHNNTHPTGARKIVVGIEQGDPEIMDLIPQPNLGGEFAGEPTWTDIYCEIMGIDPQDLPDDGGQDMYEVYCAAFQQAAQDRVLTDARRIAG